MKNGVFWMLSHVALVIADVSDDLSASFIRVTKFVQLGRTLATNASCEEIIEEILEYFNIRRNIPSQRASVAS
jgi:hypothetical protein